MKPTPPKTDDTKCEGIHPNEMTPSEAGAVTHEILAHMRPRRDRFGEYHNPIVPGIVRADRNGAQWVTWAPDPTKPAAHWYRLIDIPSLVMEGFAGGRIVFDACGWPLGNDEGPLLLTEARGAAIAICANTGWEEGRKIEWE